MPRIIDYICGVGGRALNLRFIDYIKGEDLTYLSLR